MAAHYDTYDYPAYWSGRDYEHKAEIEALKAFLKKIPKIKSILEIGAGFGRLVPSYSYRGKKVILSDPSLKLLSQARLRLTQRKIRFLHSKVENLAKKLDKESLDLIICVRVIHHIKDIEQTFKIINRLLKNRGYLILEFANKSHFKASLSQLIRGNITFPLDIFPSDRRSKKSLKNKTLPFLNYHPEVIKNKLEDNGFTIVETRSVSNIRSSTLKKFISCDALISIEKNLQLPLGSVNFGPSIFLLAQKRI